MGDAVVTISDGVDVLTFIRTGAPEPHTGLKPYVSIETDGVILSRSKAEKVIAYLQAFVNEVPEED